MNIAGDPGKGGRGSRVDPPGKAVETDGPHSKGLMLCILGGGSSSQGDAPHLCPHLDVSCMPRWTTSQPSVSGVGDEPPKRTDVIARWEAFTPRPRWLQTGLSVLILKGWVGTKGKMTGSRLTCKVAVNS